MSALVLVSTLTAVGPGITSSFLASGGTGPYTYAVRAGGAGGSIAASGLYTAPSTVPTDPKLRYDVVTATDSTAPTPLTVTAKILVGLPIHLVLDIVKTQLGLDDSHMYLWDQKLMQPTDSGLYCAVSMPLCKPFASNTEYDGNGNEVQTVNMSAVVDFDVISRSSAARDQKEQVILALMSDYSRGQQLANSFYLARVSQNFLNLSGIDGAAIPYRYKISVGMQYTITKTQASPYFSTIQTPTVATNP